MFGGCVICLRTRRFENQLDHRQKKKNCVLSFCSIGPEDLFCLFPWKLTINKRTKTWPSKKFPIYFDWAKRIKIHKKTPKF
jgi:hypothetical protein